MQNKLKDHRLPRARKLFLTAAPLGVAALLSACQYATTGDLYEGVGYREARFAEISAVREYRSCVDEAMAIDTKARQSNDTARYLTSARILEKCEADMGPDAKSVAEEERMRAYALSIQNYAKGSDVARARENLETFKKTFSGRDLYYADGASFIDTMELIVHAGNMENVAFLNVSKGVRAEMRRISYWKQR